MLLFTIGLQAPPATVVVLAGVSQYPSEVLQVRRQLQLAFAVACESGSQATSQVESPGPASVAQYMQVFPGPQLPGVRQSHCCPGSGLHTTEYPLSSRASTTFSMP